MLNNSSNLDATHYRPSPPSVFPPLVLPFNTTRITVLPSCVTVIPNNFGHRITTPCVMRPSKSSYYYPLRYEISKPNFRLTYLPSYSTGKLRHYTCHMFT
ncbi:hypothetical protein RHMOL_Rhmol07G0147100 [Rhododendron molle]|uniref:Uncharacterized protein n=1 Tax=Rhododendron molle TaxID=49168 RepID=A0ACC0N0V7_RHOML|nr:hypothetical protein RHMOL_Rhmol07G0147100 [Rhododendron molle]